MRLAARILAWPAGAGQPAAGRQQFAPLALADEQLPDPKQEAEAAALMEEIRCLVCQGQSIADSDAELAGDMRAVVRGGSPRAKSPERSGAG